MHGTQRSGNLPEFVNPVYPKSFPDPFVLKHRGEYFGYSTGFGADGRVFSVINSKNLVDWEDVGSAMEPIDDAPPFYWAPEVSYDNGKFYLYYSAGNESLMSLRVAVSDRPDGGFVDSGRVLTTEEFAIDAHVFVDDDGQRFMFYATDFLEHTHIGTGIVIDRMVDWFTLAGDPRPVTRAKFDWQVYDPQRKEKGGVRWHTVEGPSVLKRKGRYYEMFSGGNWQNTTYGVSFAVSDRIDSDSEWSQYCDGATVLPILRTIPESAVGPGHNSVVRGPNNRELYCIYHKWTDAGRVMAIDRMDFSGTRLFVIGATFTPQPAPYAPALDDNSLLSSAGEWLDTKFGVESSLSEACERSYSIQNSFLCEFTFCCWGWKGESSDFGFRLGGSSGTVFEFSIQPVSRTGTISFTSNGVPTSERFYLPIDFILTADHLMRVEVEGTRISLRIDKAALSLSAQVERPAELLTLTSRRTAVEFSGLSITNGFEDCFEWDGEIIESNQWEIGGEYKFSPKHSSGEISISSDSECYIKKGAMFSDAEFASNIRLATDKPQNSSYGLQLCDSSGGVLVRFGISGGEAFAESVDNVDSNIRRPLIHFDETDYHQFRAVRFGGEMTVFLDESLIGKLPVSSVPAQLAIFCVRSEIAVEMVRVTEI